jgi:phosphatidylinositol-4,5-bisphosphate 3-kinase
MDSKMKPLWLLFENADPLGENMNVIFKAGDDLRQDKLTLQMFHIMDKMWKRENLNLMLNPYNVIATGADTGMIEVVTSSNTVSKIEKQIGGGALGAFNDTVIRYWLELKNSQLTPKERAEVFETFTASCAGYCVATYVLGIGDRHNDNIMIQENGRLFHIDFGHFLGNFKKKFGIERERVPFVFTPAMKQAMGGKSGENYKKFIQYCVLSHQILRQNFNLFINLFSMMLISGMPELSSKEDIWYLVNTLRVGEESIPTESDFQSVLEDTGHQRSTQINFFFHNMVH